MTESLVRLVVAAATMVRSLYPSDHRAVYARIVCSVEQLKGRQLDSGRKILRYDRKALQDEEVSSCFAEVCSEGCSRILADNVQDKSTEELWESLKEIMQEAAELVLPEPEKRLTAKFITSDLKRLCQERSDILRKPANERNKRHMNFLTRTIRKGMREEKEKFLQQMCDEIKKHRNSNTAKVYAAIKTLSGKTRSNVSHVTAKRWEQHFTALFATLKRPIDRNIMEKIRSTISEELREKMARIDDSIPDAQEIKQTLSDMSNDKASGVDGLCKELYQHGGDKCIEVLQLIFGRIINGESWPEEWVESLLVPIFKKGGTTTDPNSYRGGAAPPWVPPRDPSKMTSLQRQLVGFDRSQGMIMKIKTLASRCHMLDIWSMINSLPKP